MAYYITDINELLMRLELKPKCLADIDWSNQHFSLRVPQAYVAKMQKGDAHDPLLRQVLPVLAEIEPTPGYVEDPLGEASAVVAPGVLQKYAGRVLMLVTGSCAIHCRYCFRKHYPDVGVNAGKYEVGFAYIRQHEDIEEVIISGGDPLMLGDGVWEKLIKKLEAIPHVQCVRIHTRMPVVQSERISEQLCQILARTRLHIVLVLHANHANEIDHDVTTSCKQLRAAGVTLLNQTVLLRGINDDASVLKELSKVLFNADVMPYYLHILDKVAGAAHFDLANDRILSLYRALSAELSGYLVPRLVREVPGADHKIQVCEHGVNGN